MPDCVPERAVSNESRKRRKKCDEQSPRCGGCCRNNLACTWPTAASQPVDGRRRCHRILRQESQKSSSHTSFQLNDHFDLYQDFASRIAPRLVRKSCLPEYADQTHMILLALNFPPLMAVMIAIAALDRGTPHHDQVAMESYLFSLRTLQDRMRHAADAGNPDGLLATTICMCVFENCRSDVPPNIGVHATMAGILLNLRPPNHIQSPTQTITVFERVCAESFVYHSTLMMLFDPSLDVLRRVNLDINLARFLSDFPDGDIEQCHMGTTVQPVLDASYKFFLLVADVTRMARISCSLNEDEVERWDRLQTNLTQWEGAVRGDPSRKLYILAMRILLLKVDPATSVLESTKQMDSFLRRGLLIMNGLDVRKFLLGYLLWPLAVLGSVAVEESDRHIIEGKMSLLAQTGHGQAVRVKRLMDTIWNSQGGEKPTMMLRRLRMLVEGI